MRNGRDYVCQCVSESTLAIGVLLLEPLLWITFILCVYGCRPGPYLGAMLPFGSVFYGIRIVSHISACRSTPSVDRVD